MDVDLNYNGAMIGVAPANDRFDAEVGRITRAAEMVTYGGDYLDSAHSSAESNATLPDSPPMMPGHVLDFTDDDEVAHFAATIQEAYLAKNIYDRVKELDNIIKFHRQIGLSVDQMELLRSEPRLELAVREMLFEMPALRRQNERKHARAAQVLLPIFGIQTQETILRFIISEWGSLPTMSSTYIQSEFKDGMVRIIKPTRDECLILENEDNETVDGLLVWMGIALNSSLMESAETRDPLIRIAVRAFAELGDRFNPSSACLVLMVERLLTYGGIQTSTEPFESLPLLAMRTNLETMIVYIHMFPRLIQLLPPAEPPRQPPWQPPQPIYHRPFKLAVAFTIAFRARATTVAIMEILELALQTGILDTDPAVVDKFASGRDGAIDILCEYALMYGDRFVLEANSFTGNLLQRNRVRARGRLPLPILISEMVKANPRLWNWLIAGTGHTPSKSKKEAYYALANDVIREQNQLWTPIIS